MKVLNIRFECLDSNSLIIVSYAAVSKPGDMVKRAVYTRSSVGPNPAWHLSKADKIQWQHMAYLLQTAAHA